MPGEHTQCRFAGAGAELEHRLERQAVSGRGDRLLELLVARELVEHLGEVRVGIPLEIGSSHLKYQESE